MKAFAAGLNAGLKDSGTWALKAATDLKRVTIGAVSGSASTNELGDIDCHLADGPEEHLARLMPLSSYFPLCVPAEDSACGRTASLSTQVIEICSATGLPSQTSFVALSVADNTGMLKGRRVTTIPRIYTNEPIWNRCLACFRALFGSSFNLASPAPARSPVLNAAHHARSPRDLAAEPRPGDVLLIEVYSTDFSKLICSGHVALELLVDNSETVELKLRRQLDIRLQGAHWHTDGPGPCILCSSENN